ncbi:HipA domain-containing protein [Methylobacterium sp. 092160098-2]|uniref:type II toxin-antitoxin system HipA family toxin n=1 Tax=Methylobacterium sp. 092160098-2 TaxID=3025129 RepID=UPI002381CD99|nr:HipA domain-containing protein [Methylobacterium sp. 092160098-2]MDE4914497.1 HipA domain-containing protein [Methylobacterium sp. 092160098-2]
MDLTLQLHHTGAWHDAAVVEIKEPSRGVGGATTVAYDDAYFLDHGAESIADDIAIRDERAISVLAPIDLEIRNHRTWPPYLLDLMPQGHARRRLSETMGIDANAAASELPLLLRAASAPFGNLRIKEAYEAERDRLNEWTTVPGVGMDEMLHRSERFQEVADMYALVASGSSGHQGEWPKITMTKARDGLWYPDPVVPDDEAVDHVLVKLLRSNEESDRLILEAEAAYVGIAAAFGIRVHAVPIYGHASLVVPRFDRSVGPEGVVRLGQESVVSAIGIAAFGHTEAHETYLEMLRGVSSDPESDVAEYVLRDALNLAMGNPDNHGRNTALSKGGTGGIRLSPLFDFAPMRLAPADRGRPTKWACMRSVGSDHDPDWRIVCAAAAGRLDAGPIEDLLLSKLDLFRRLPELAAEHGVPAKVIEIAIVRQSREVADGIAALERPKPVLGCP